MRSIQHRVTGESYEEFLTRLAEATGVEEPTREDLERFDRKREGKKTSNRDWTNPSDPDAKVGKMKDCRVTDTLSFHSSRLPGRGSAP